MKQHKKKRDRAVSSVGKVVWKANSHHVTRFLLKPKRRADLRQSIFRAVADFAKVIGEETGVSVSAEEIARAAKVF